MQMPFRLPRLVLKIGPSSDRINQWIDQTIGAIETALRIDTDGQIGISQSPAGTVLTLELPESFWVQLTSTAGADGGYAWTEVIQKPLVTITTPGTGYTSAPAVAVSGGGGSGAVAVATIRGGAVVAVYFTTPGTGFTSNPTLGFSGGGGSGAVATVNGLAWQTTSRTSGAAGGDMAYDPNGSRSYVAGTTPYRVRRNKPTGQLIIDQASSDLVPFKLGGTGIAAGALTGLVSGTVTLYGTQPTGNPAAGSSATLYNFIPVAIPANATGWCKFDGTRYYAVTWSC